MSKGQNVAGAADLLTAEQQRHYLTHGGNRCPWCEAEEIEGTGQSNSDGDWHDNEITCNACGAVWLDIYTITGIQGVSGPAKQVVPGIVVETADSNHAQGACAGKPWEAWHENGRWRVAGHGWYPGDQTSAIIAAIRKALRQKKNA